MNAIGKIENHYFTIFIILLITVAISVFFISSLNPPITLEARDGKLDLTDWDFLEDGNIKLNGEWEFYWHRFLIKKGNMEEPDADPLFTNLPGTWDRLNIHRNELPGHGWASYRLQVKIKNPGEVMGVLVKPMSTAYELWIDGQLIASNGKIGDSKETAKPQYLNQVSFFNPKGETIELVLQVSNFVHRSGGVWRPILMGSAKQIHLASDSRQRTQWTQSVTMLVLALYHLAVFFQRRKEVVGLYLSGFLFFMAIRVVVIGDRILYGLLQDFSWEFCHKLEYLSIMISLPFLAAFLTRLYPDETRPRIIKAFMLYSGLSIAIVLFTTADTYSWIIIPYEIVVSLLGVYLLYINILAVRHKRQYAKVLLVAALFLWLLGVNDALYANHIIFTTEAFHYGILVAGIFQTFTLSRIFVGALDSSEHLTLELARKNAILDKSNKEKEIRSWGLEQQLIRSQKLEAIGTLSGGIAHDFNNILGTMLGYIELLIDTKSADSEEKKYLDEVYKAGERAAELVKQILTFSRANESELRPVQIAPIIKEVLRMLRATLPATIEIAQSIQPDTDTILANEAQIHQIIINLFNNASQAIEDENGKIHLTLDEIEIDEEQASISDLKSGKHLRLMIEDNGKGMTKAVVDRVFDPFFSTKDIGSGTGLGLSVVHGIVKNHFGEITVSSTPGEGAVFTIYFPVIRSQTIEEAENPIPQIRGKGHVLIVDDEKPLANFYGLALQKNGYHVTVADDAMDVLTRIQADQYKYDLVLTDQAMPHISGIQLSSKIREISQRIPIVMVTGYQNEELLSKAKTIGIVTVLKKPIKISDLGLAVQSAINPT